MNQRLRNLKDEQKRLILEKEVIQKRLNIIWDEIRLLTTTCIHDPISINDIAYACKHCGMYLGHKGQ